MRLGLDQIQIPLKKRLDYSIYAGIIFISILVYLVSPSWLNHANLTYIQEDRVFVQRQADKPNQDVVVVAIDDSSIVSMGKWPWSREKLSQLVWAINLARPKVIGLDLNLSEDVTQDTSGNTQLLADIVKEVRNVVLPMYFSFSEVGMEFPRTPPFIYRSALELIPSQSADLKLPIQARRIDYPDQKIAREATCLGHVNLSYGAGNKIRDEVMLVKYQDKFYPSFTLQMAKKYLGADIIVKDGGKLFLGDYRIPIDRKGGLHINFGSLNGNCKHIPAWWVLNDKINARDLYGKAVLVGLTFSTTSNKFPTPVAPAGMFEVDRAANVVENLIHQNYIDKEKLPGLWNILILLAIGLFCAVSFPQIALSYRFAVVFILMVMTIHLNYVLFPSLGLLSQPSYQVLELVLFAIFAPVVESISPRSKQKKSEPEPEEQDEYVSQEEMESVPIRVIRENEHTLKVETRISVKDNAQFEQNTPTPSSEISSENIVKSTTSSLKQSTAHLGIKQFGRYEILGLLGKGAMGTVYKGKDPAIDRLVALKTIRIDFSENEDEINELRERLMREAQAAGGMSHPNIVTIYDVGQEGDFQYIAMEYLEGYTLESYLRKKSDLNYKIVAKIIMQVCEALSYAHSKGIVHRDIKPANIMILDNFEVKVMDFGIARFGVSSMTQAGTTMGTPHYISPEQLEGKSADKRSDIFSTGVILYEVLTGQKPFKGDNISALAYSIINDNPPMPTQVNDKTPPIFDRIVTKAIAKDPNERYQNAEEITKTFKEFISSFVVSRSVKL